MRLRDSLFAPHELQLFEHTALVRHRLEEQYRDLDHQSEAASHGMWVFLATEVLFFGALFVSVGAYWIMHREAVEAASEKLNWLIGGINTVVLLISSYTMALAVHFARTTQQRKVVWLLIATAALGAAFLGLKGVEYYIDYRENLIPGWRFEPEEWIEEKGLTREQVGPVQVFLLFYWIMTLIHALHLTIGIAAVLVVAFLAHRRHFSPEYSSPVEVMGLYWHFIDLVWIFLLPTLYLLGTHHL